MTTMNTLMLAVLVGVSATAGIGQPLEAQSTPMSTPVDAAAATMPAAAYPHAASVARDRDGPPARRTSDAGLSLRPTALSARLVAAPAPDAASRTALQPALAVQQRNRAGIPWIIAGAALVVGGAIVGDDVGTVLMVGGVVATSYGLFIYF